MADPTQRRPAIHNRAPRLPLSVAVTSAFHKNAVIRRRAVWVFLLRRPYGHLPEAGLPRERFDGVLKRRSRSWLVFDRRAPPPPAPLSPVFAGVLERSLAAPARRLRAGRRESGVWTG